MSASEVFKGALYKFSHYYYYYINHLLLTADLQRVVGHLHYNAL